MHGNLSKEKVIGNVDGWENAHEDAPAGVYTRNVVYTEVL